MSMDMLAKRTPYRNPKMRKAARGKPCTLRLPGICTGGGQDSVLAHSPFAEDGAGKGQKADDHTACIACCACHDEIDGRTNKAGLKKADRRDYFHIAMKRTLRLWLILGIMK